MNMDTQKCCGDSSKGIRRQNVYYVQSVKCIACIPQESAFASADFRVANAEKVAQTT